jgi:ATP-dependent DNA helicase RecG
LARLGLSVVRDLFYYFPRRYEDRTVVKPVSEMNGSEKECVWGVVQSRGLVRAKSGTFFRAVVSDGRQSVFATFFNQPYLTRVFIPKTKVVLIGQVEQAGRHFQMVHPEFEVESGPPDRRVHCGRIVPFYSLAEDLGQKGIRQFFLKNLEEYMHLAEDFLTPSLRDRLGFADSRFSFWNIHFPESFEALDRARRRLVFDEFFTMQLLIQMRKQKFQRENKAIAHTAGQDRVEEFIRSLGFTLTKGQEAAINDILKDMQRGRPMNRLIQGDVGSGKTAVAAAALTFTASNGFQGALMAPTEVLAQQHTLNLSQLLEPLGISCVYLGQGLSPGQREDVLGRILSGRAQIVIGTHALIQEDVCFNRLGLAVVDEQHKFGVLQRSRLKDKTQGSAHFLLMTATPIPRTLAMTLYGDLDISSIGEMPKGRRPVQTLWVSGDRRMEILALLDDHLARSRQGYVICPLIGEGGGAVKSAAAVFGELSNFFPKRRLGLLHGRLKSADKKKIMQDFKDRKIDLLISTVVIEVGVDVPNATIMIIENAEKFGLAQLHQLRGRVGRGDADSVCILFSDTSNEESIERLSAFEKTQSGFEIAEQDLRLRGAGEIIGEKQHGLPELRIGDLVKDVEILDLARREARSIIEKDPRLESPAHRLIRRALLERFETAEDKQVVPA